MLRFYLENKRGIERDSIREEFGEFKFQRVMENKEFKIKIKSSDLLRDEKKKLLWESLDLLLSENNSFSNQKIKCQQKKIINNLETSHETITQ